MGPAGLEFVEFVCRFVILGLVEFEGWPYIAASLGDGLVRRGLGDWISGV
ncbi:hypothetical protein ABIE19_003504, partial [Brevundimonas faecalis]